MSFVRHFPLSRTSATCWQGRLFELPFTVLKLPIYILAVGWHLAVTTGTQTETNHARTGKLVNFNRFWIVSVAPVTMLDSFCQLHAPRSTLNTLYISSFTESWSGLQLPTYVAQMQESIEGETIVRYTRIRKLLNTSTLVGYAFSSC